MTNFLSAIYAEMSTRMKTPLLGTFALCWLLYNHDHVAKLIFSDNTQRLALIQQTPVNLLSDLVIPLGLSLVYIFIVPLVQWGIDIAKYRFIERPRTATNYKHQLDKYRGLTKVAQQQSKTSLEYWQEVHRNNAENAGKEIIKLKEQVSNLLGEIKQKEEAIKIEKQNYSNLEQAKLNVEEELTQTIEKVNDLRPKFEKASAALEEIPTIINNLNTMPVGEFQLEGKEVTKLFETAEKLLATKPVPISDIRRLVDSISRHVNKLYTSVLSEKNDTRSTLASIRTLVDDNTYTEGAVTKKPFRLLT